MYDIKGIDGGRSGKSRVLFFLGRCFFMVRSIRFLLFVFNLLSYVWLWLWLTLGLTSIWTRFGCMPPCRCRLPKADWSARPGFPCLSWSRPRPYVTYVASTQSHRPLLWMHRQPRTPHVGQASAVEPASRTHPRGTRSFASMVVVSCALSRSAQSHFPLSSWQLLWRGVVVVAVMKGGQ